MFHVEHETPGLLEAPDVSRETLERLELFACLIGQWSRTINLVAPGDTKSLWERHIADSLQLLPLLPASGPWADLGSGAGFPGLVLAIATGMPIHLVESDLRKAAFLREAARRCSSQATVHAIRIEHAILPRARLITARALASLPDLLHLAAPHLAADGVCLFLKGRNAATELTLAAAKWHMQIQRWQSRTSEDAVVLQISGLAPRARSER